jgi:hypothetical protein
MNAVITVDVALWGLVVGTVLPIVVGLVTKSNTDAAVKAVVLLGLAAVISVGQEIVAEGSFEVKATLLKLALLFLTSVGAHFGLLKPAGVTGAGSATAGALNK